MLEAQDLAFAAARVIDEKHGTAIRVIDVRGIADIADFFVIATASNRRLVDALIDDVEEALKPLGADPFSIEGREECTWALIDYGTVIVHVFQPQTRDYYRLERLWNDAPSYDVIDGEIIARELPQAPEETAEQA